MALAAASNMNPSTLPNPSGTLNPTTAHLPFVVPIWAPGKEPLPPGLTESDRPLWEQNKKMERFMGMAMESCVAKSVLAGGAGKVFICSLIICIHGAPGFGLGAFFSLMSSSFAYEDPYLRSQTSLNTTQKARHIFKEMGKGMLSSGKSFGKIGALFAGVECVIESVSFLSLSFMVQSLTSGQYRAKNDIYNSVSSGFISGGILARSTGPKGVLTGGLAFAAFSAAIDLLFIRREPSE